MVGARSAAMMMNRIADVEFDRRNPRTATRALATGALSLRFAWLFTLLAAALLVVAAWQLNPLALKLSPVVLIVLFVPSGLMDLFTRRWSFLALGRRLAVAGGGR